MANSTVDQIRARLSRRSVHEGEAPHTRRDRLILAVLALVGLTVLAVTLWHDNGDAGAAITVAAAAEDGATAAVADPPAGHESGVSTRSVPARPERIRVHVAGAVARPGVLALPEGTIAEEAVAAAGGALPEADLARVNLAGKLTDGQQFFVPRSGEAVPAPASGTAPVGAVGAAGARVDINTADVAVLDSLPGIGAATAQKIVAHRDEHGPFRDVRGLLDVPGIGEGKLAAIADLVTT